MKLESSNKTVYRSPSSNSAQRGGNGALHRARGHAASKKRPRRKKDHFGRSYLRFVLISLTAIVCLLTVFWLYLKDYQDTLPSGLAAEATEAYRSGDAAFISQHCALPEHLKDPAVFSRYIAEYVFDPGIFYFKAGSEGAFIRFDIRARNRRIATVTVEDTGEKSTFGFSKYRISGIENYPAVKYEINAPQAAEILINGQPIDQKYLSSADKGPPCFEEIGTAASRANYVIEDFSYIDSLSATLNGVACSVDRRDGVYSINLIPSETVQSEIRAFAEKASRAYTYFAQARNAPLGPFLAYVYPDTRYVGKLNNYGNEWGQIYDSDRYEDFSVTDFRQFSDTEFSCDVSYRYIMLRGGQEGEKSLPFHMTYYLTRKSGEFLLVDMQPK